jgi:hypothetical protein
MNLTTTVDKTSSTAALSLLSEKVDWNDFNAATAHTAGLENHLKLIRRHLLKSENPVVRAVGVARQHALQKVLHCARNLIALHHEGEVANVSVLPGSLLRSAPRCKTTRMGRIDYTITFDRVHLSATRSGKCSTCGKKTKRTRREEQTVNPYNKTADGRVKTRSDIVPELKAALDKWKATPLHCTACEH